MTSSSVRILLIFLSSVLAIILLPFSIFACVRIVNVYEKAVVFRLGIMKKGMPVGAGIVFILPCIDDFYRIDCRTLTIDLRDQQVLTKDLVTVVIDGVVYFRVVDSLKAILNVEDYRFATLLYAMAALRNVIGRKGLLDILTERNALAHAMEITLDIGTYDWGIEVERVEIKEVSLTKHLQRSMAIEAEAVREANAKLLAAKGELQSAKAYCDAADELGRSPLALELRYLQTINDISQQKESTILFPLPLQLYSDHLILKYLRSSN